MSEDKLTAADFALERLHLMLFRVYYWIDAHLIQKANIKREKNLVFFSLAPSERSSSAPVSPVSVCETPLAMLDHSRLPSTANGQRQPPPVTIYRSNRSRAMRWKPQDTYRFDLTFN